MSYLSKLYRKKSLEQKDKFFTNFVLVALGIVFLYLLAVLGFFGWVIHKFFV